jgi:hypothetical protein
MVVEIRTFRHAIEEGVEIERATAQFGEAAID